MNGAVSASDEFGANGEVDELVKLVQLMQVLNLVQLEQEMQ